MPSLSAYDAYVPKNKTLREVLGANVATLRASKNLSQAAVAKAAKRAGGQIDQRTVGRIEQSDNPVTLDLLESLAKGLGVPSWQLLIPDGCDANFLAILSAWAEGGDAGRKLLFIAARGALGDREPEQPRPQQQWKAGGAER